MAFLDHKLTVLSGQTVLRHPEGCVRPCLTEIALTHSPIVPFLRDGLYAASGTSMENLHVQEIQRKEKVG